MPRPSAGWAGIELWQLVRFGVVGMAATGMHYAVALPVSWIVSPYAANVAGYLAALGLSYLGHHRFTFRLAPGDGRHRRRFPRFAVASVGALLLSQGLLAAVTATQTPDWLALLVAVGSIPVVSFILVRLWVFAEA